MNRIKQLFTNFKSLPKTFPKPQLTPDTILNGLLVGYVGVVVSDTVIQSKKGLDAYRKGDTYAKNEYDAWRTGKKYVKNEYDAAWWGAYEKMPSRLFFPICWPIMYTFMAIPYMVTKLNPSKDAQKLE